MSDWFACRSCGEEVTRDFTCGVLPGGQAGGVPTVIIAYWCECDAESYVPKTERFPANRLALRRLLGPDVSVPWKNPFPLVAVPDTHPDLVEMRELLDEFDVAEEPDEGD